MVGYKVRSNVDKVAKGLNKKAKEINKQSKVLPRRMAREGAEFAKRIAPKDTGTLIQAISFTTTKKKWGGEAFIYVRGLDRPGARDERDRTTFYGWQMHYGWPNFKPRNNKDRFFMFTTREMIKKRYGRDAKIAIGQILK